jgi:hypothetical protein
MAGREVSSLELSSLERRIASAAGAQVDLRVGDLVRDDPGRGPEWGPERTVRAEFLRELLTAQGAPGRRVLRVRGARVTGLLDLEGADLPFSILLQDCYMDEPVSLCEARAAVIRLPGCHMPSLQARQLETQGNLILSDGFNAASVDLRGAHIGGVLNMDGAVLSNPGKTTLHGGALTVEQGMNCGSGFTSRGLIYLIGARIMHGLSFTGAKLENPSGWALDAQGMSVSYALFLGSSLGNRSGFVAEGGVRLVGVRVDGFVSAWDARITAAGDGRLALAALGLQVTENLMLSRGFTAHGQVYLTNARIRDEIDLSSATLSSPGGQAFTAERLDVGGSVLCTSGFTVIGAVNLAGSKMQEAWISPRPISLTGN